MNSPEEFDWQFGDEIPDDFDWEGYSFDTNFFIEGHSDDGDSGYAIFRIMNPDLGIAKYLAIYNIHNGYYGHGFDFGIQGTTKLIRTGVL